MVSQRLKNIYYATVGSFSYLNFLKLKVHNPYVKRSDLVLHLGSGTHRIARPNFVNIDGNPMRPVDLWLDVTVGLPFPEESVRAIFSNHFVEHLTEEQLVGLLQESFRVLKPGGTIRLVTPDLAKSIRAYLGSDETFFSDFPDERRSVGGRFNNHLLCRDQHRLMFDFSFMRELLEKAGFADCREVTPARSSYFKNEELKEMSSEPEKDFPSLFVEAIKPTNVVALRKAS